MIYSTNPEKQRRYDRTDYQLEPQWIERRGVRIRRTALAVLVPAALGLAAFLGNRQQEPGLVFLWVMTAAMLPCLVLWPVAIMTWNNDRATCRGVAICRFDDRLDLQPKRLIYSYRDRRDGRRGARYESSVPYSLLDRILYFPDRQFLVLWCGGVDTVYDADGAAVERTNYWTGFGHINRCNHRVFLPMVYDDNEQLLRDLQELSGTEVERYPGTSGKVPPGKELPTPGKV